MLLTVCTANPYRKGLFGMRTVKAYCTSIIRTAVKNKLNLLRVNTQGPVLGLRAIATVRPVLAISTCIGLYNVTRATE